MDLNWLQSILYGLFSGFAEILPVSAQAHSTLLLRIFGSERAGSLMMLMIHVGTLAGIYWAMRRDLVRINRALNLARIPKRRRRRPLDMKSIQDFCQMRMMLIPIIVAFLFFSRVEAVRDDLILIGVFMLINGVILYVPQFFPTGNKDSRGITTLESLLFGIATAFSLVPGFSGIAVALSCASVRGVDKNHALTTTLICYLGVLVGFCVFDVLSIIDGGAGALGFGILLKYIMSGLCAFGGSLLGVRTLRQVVGGVGISVFGLYCWGVALFTFILNLMA